MAPKVLVVFLLAWMSLGTLRNVSANFLYLSQNTQVNAETGYIKISSRAYEDIYAAPDLTFYVCTAGLRTDGTIQLWKSTYTNGQDGPPEPRTVTQIPAGDPFIDMDVADSESDCQISALTSTGWVYGPFGGSYAATLDPLSQYLQIEASPDSQFGEANRFFINDTFWSQINGTFPEVFPAHSMDVIYKGQTTGINFAAVSGGPDTPIKVMGTDVGGTPSWTTSFHGIHPTLAYLPDSLVVGAENPTGIWFNINGVTENYARQNQASVKYSAPTLRFYDYMRASLSMLKNNTSASSPSTAYEMVIITNTGELVANKSKTGVKYVTHATTPEFIFVTYMTDSGVFLDVMKYLEGYVEPVAQPIAQPVSEPINSPVSSPIADSPQGNNSPIDGPIASPNNGAAVVPTAPPVVGAEVLGPAITIPIGAAALSLFLLLFLLNKKKKKAKKSKTTTLLQPLPGAAYIAVPVSGSSNTTSTSGYATLDADAGDVANPTAILPSEIDKRMHIPYKSLVFEKEVGAGSYGKVFVGEWRGAKVAIKVNNSITDIDGFLAEAKLTLGITPHPNLVQTFGVSLDGPNPCIVLEFCGGGSLDTLVFKNASTVTAEQRREYALKIAYGLLHLHNNNIVHRDLAARNILLANDGQPKISDFGMSRIVKDEEAKGKTKNNVGPLRWMSPESLKDQTYSTKSDVWSYGILVWELVAGQEPHMEEDQLYVGLKIRDEGFTPAIPEGCDPVLKEVMKMCWAVDPQQRPTMQEVADYIRSH